MMMGVTAITMTITPLLLLINERLILPRFGTKEKEGKKADEIDESNPVIIAGFGHFGSLLDPGGDHRDADLALQIGIEG